MPDFAIYPSLRGRNVFVSGGGSGIGASIVEHFAAQGAKVGFVDVDEAAAKTVAGKTGALFLKCDIRDVKAIVSLPAKEDRQLERKLVIDNQLHGDLSTTWSVWRAA